MPPATANSRALTRALERHGSAVIRGLSAEVGAEYRGGRLRVDGRPFAFATPYLVVDFASLSLQRSRGVADALAVRLRFSNSELHRRQQPGSPFARIVFDILEQLRTESLVPTNWRGVRVNLDQAFHDWCRTARDDGMVESNIGILLYTLIHMVRARLVNSTDDEDVASLIEATRASLSPRIGHPFYQLHRLRHDQAAYAVPAREIADVLSKMVGAEFTQDTTTHTVLERHAVLLGPDWDTDDSTQTEAATGATHGGDDGLVDAELECAGDYRVFIPDYDRVIAGEALYRPEQLSSLRVELDRQVAGQAVSVTRLAVRLQRLFALERDDGWLFGQDEGLLDGRRLAQLVSHPGYHQVFRRNRPYPVGDTVISFLVDNSGSMKSQRYESVAVLLDTYARALDLAGISSEILGFTTGAWNGGRPLALWRASGMPDAPGRLNETLHIVYKEADAAWKRARLSLAGMLKTLHFREGVDGEALIWAYRRLRSRKERRRLLIVISDGAPLDAATFNANREGYLSDHLQAVVRFLERQGDIELAAIGIDQDLSECFSNAINIDLSGTLNIRSYGLLEQLFPRR